MRHALKPRATIIIAESQFKIPFDASHIVVRHYEHLGPDIGFDEANRMQRELADLARALMSGNAVDSPVYTVLPDLEKPSRRGQAGPAPREERGSATPRPLGDWRRRRRPPPTPMLPNSISLAKR